MISTKRAVIGVALIVAFAAYYRYTHKPCPMCENESLIRCEGCKGKGIKKIRVVTVANIGPSAQQYLGISRHFGGERRKRLKTPIERLCTVCKGTGKCACPNCKARMKFDLNANDEPIRRHIYTAEGKLIRTEEINPSALPKPKAFPTVKQIKFVQ